MKKRLSATSSAILETTKTKRLVSFVLFIWLIAGIAPVYPQEGPKSKLFLKTGRVIECDQVWKASKDIVRCKKESGAVLYSIDDVDLKKTFGAGFGEYREITGEADEEKEKIPSSPVVGAETSNYVALKGGFYSPESDDLEEFDRGLSGEIAIGHYCNPNFALEVGVGYFETDATFQAVDPMLGIYREQDEITVTPVTLTGKAVNPMDKVELFGEVGVGFYFVSGEADASWTGLGGGSIHLDDDDTVFGFHLGLGANFDIAENLFLGLEGKYLWAEAEFEAYGFTLEADLDGFIITAILGFRY
jgi:opacity protein-like surface antigen